MSDRQSTVDALFQEAQRLPPDERLEWLRAECAGDVSLLREVSAKLADPTTQLETAPDPANLAPGTLISHYRLISRLGAGGMGEVWLATDETLGRKVALKFPIALLTTDSSSRHRLLREARSAAALDHPSVCRVFELGEASGRPFIAMELVPGETLAARLARGPLPVPQALGWGAALAAALDAAHRKGIVHRDLKPANIMVTPAAEVKVMDFGLARPLPRVSGGTGQSETVALALTAPGMIVGTLAYMAPELLEGAPADEKSDLWALGCIFFEMLSGAHPFHGSAAPEVIGAILEREPDLSKLPPQTPAEVRLLIARALRKDPARRMRDAGDVRLVLEDAREAFRDGGAREDSPAPLTGRDRPEAGVPAGFTRRQLILGAGAAGLLGAGVGAGALLAASHEEREVPSYQRLTFRRGMIRNARFAPDQQTVLYGALWDGDVCRTFTVRPESPESRPMELPPSTPLSISASGELALLLGDHLRGLWPIGTLARVPLAGGAPRELLENVSFADWSPEGKELAVVTVGAQGDRLEFPAGKVILESKTTLSFPRVSPDGKSLAVFDHGIDFGGSVVIVDRSGATRYRSPEFLELFGLSWRGDEVWFTAAEDRRTFRAIHAVRPPGLPRLVMRMPGNATLHDISSEGRLLIAHTLDRSEIAALPPGETVERTLSWLDGSMVADLSRDGRTVLFTEIGQGGGRNNSVYVRGTDGTPAVRLGEGRALALSPDSQWAAVLPQLSAPHLDLLPTGAGAPRRVELPRATFIQARWLPDGQRIIVSVDQEGSGRALLVLSLSGGAPKRITPNGAPLGRWAVAPGGSSVAVTHREAEPQIFPVDGGPARPLPGVRTTDLLWDWIDRGLLVTEKSSGGVVFVVDPVTGERERWREIVPSDPAGIMNVGNLIATPDGRSYVYWWHRALSDLYLVSGVE